ncbi:AMP-binding protein [Streptomyces sp. RG80]|uniref:AMP-binding protein n=1 Tax=Streptomyces sp. RG80 TaxID=3157340 RepID=UPI00338DEF5B
MDGEEAKPADGTLRLETLRARGRTNTAFDFDATWRSIQPDDVLALIYTSGRTGPSKGVEITHADVLAQAAGVAQVLDFRFGDRTTSYLPSAHVVDCFTCLYAQAISGVQVTVVSESRASRTRPSGGCRGGVGDRPQTYAPASGGQAGR